ncbi:hypothetical protein [Tropicibacter alexandrii]|uniref:hypothetical protein n=1 Tax=Tropicibacter alexandrii TaxID=2267683 RepID=UPI000EF47AFF|nr:hypothetical protein [Tropicibacter alexandrii]
MENTLDEFRKRQSAITRKHSRMARGYVNKLDKTSGVIVQQPDSKTGSVGRSVLLRVAVAFMVLKVLTLSWLGPELYESHLAQLREGSTVERAGAFVMQVDPVTAKGAALLSPLMH